MAKINSLKLYNGFKLENFPEEISFDPEAQEEAIIPEVDEYCITFTEYIFNANIDGPIFEIKESFENVHGIFVQNNFKKNQNKRDEFILDKNQKQVIIASDILAKYRSKSLLYPDSLTDSRKIQYLVTVLSEFDNWYARNKLKMTVKTGQISDLKEIKWGELKRLAKEFCELLIKNGKITEILEETKSEKSISDLVIPEMEKIYNVKPSNKGSIHQYFRKLELELKKDKDGNIVVIEKSRRKNKKV